MKTKVISCHVCHGSGSISKCGENRSWSETCGYCHGMGTEEVPITNADRIRAMRDEELADFFFESSEIEFEVCEYCSYFGGHTSDTPCKHDMGSCLIPAKNGAFKKWLQQPVKEGNDMSEWISVKDNMPVYGSSRVLVCVGNSVVGQPKIDTDRYFNGSWVRYDGMVTHWMPLPPAPEDTK